MKFKSGILLGFGAGYVLGAKAGKERYQQIVEATRAFRENPGVQRLTEQINQTVATGKDRVSEIANRKVEQVGSGLADQAAKAKEFVGSSGSGTTGEPAGGSGKVTTSPSRTSTSGATSPSSAGASPSTSGSSTRAGSSKSP
jgi:hypothetical protein